MLVLSGCDNTYTQISQEEALQMMEEGSDFLIVDVRRPDEFREGHIVDAINLPNETIEEDAPEVLTDKDQTLFIYCRTGRRSKEASQKLVDMGYTNVYEFGGINTWEGEIVKEGE
jgi:rhodanese-related sulfurtransferase